MFRRRELTGTSIWIRWREWSSVCCIFFLKSVSSFMYLRLEFSWACSVSGKKCLSYPRKTLVLFHRGSMFAFGWILHHSKAWMMSVGVALSMIHVSVAVANNFVHSSTAADQGYHAFGELARSVYCLLQKHKKASSLPLVQRWEEYVVPNHSRFPALDDKDFLAGTRETAALDKVSSQYLQT